MTFSGQDLSITSPQGIGDQVYKQVNSRQSVSGIQGAINSKGEAQTTNVRVDLVAGSNPIRTKGLVGGNAGNPNSVITAGGDVPPYVPVSGVPARTQLLYDYEIGYGNFASTTLLEPTAETPRRGKGRAHVCYVCCHAERESNMVEFRGKWYCRVRMCVKEVAAILKREYNDTYRPANMVDERPGTNPIIQ